jgi:hypothetical protein
MGEARDYPGILCRHHGRTRGKLTWAGRAWATGTLFTTATDLDELAADAAFWGIDPTLLADAGDEDGEGVWPENLPAVAAFLAVATQWRVVGLADGSLRTTGLDYAGARAALDALNVEVTPGLWSDVQVIEDGALAGLNKANG